ncbi:MAG: methylenetetrahydrofolate--tRNA-(uracil(54)-C(5))-methyltransferase (FADH(2)-oxidizing) TrmFO [Phototrophicales bacterium]|nr:MAG: methylenetetrahydrofolate--tRNA-(uracil(54)-C(5))-methyltransferase (FADH(2)-oxidizing) TrmFO [Phototrophicales bacterium]
MTKVTIVGGGLAGAEAAWQLAEFGCFVNLYEMRPVKTTPAHVTDKLAELVCSNSLGSNLPDRASGLLKSELKLLRSKLMVCANEAAVPAGNALAVDRGRFSELVTENITRHPNINLIHEEVVTIPDEPVIIATGPLTSPALSEQLAALTGKKHLYFYDALSPIVSYESIDMTKAFRADRRVHSADNVGDYINCPLDQQEYENFVTALLEAERVPLRDFEQDETNFFEGCLPIEVLASRGRDALAYGPMRPIGLINPHTGKRPYAVVQLRRDNFAGTLYNLVGFQTNIRWGQQREILRMIPGLEKAEFVRLGQMHRNTFVNSPTLLDPTMQFRKHPGLFLAGQLTGIEGYVGNIASGLVAAINIARSLNNQTLWSPPPTSMLGALCNYVAYSEAKYFQPMKANFGILPSLPEKIKNKRERYRSYAKRALEDLEASINKHSIFN